MASLIYPASNLNAADKLCIERGEGVYVYDDAGNRYLVQSRLI